MSRISSAITAMNGERITSAEAVKMISMSRFSISQHFIVRRGGKGEKRGRPKAFQLNAAVHVREEVDSDMSSNALFVAEQEDVFEFGQPAAIDGENDFIDDLVL